MGHDPHSGNHWPNPHSHMFPLHPLQPHKGVMETLTGDVEYEVNSSTGRRQTEAHDDEDGGIRRDAHQHPEHHWQDQGDQQGLGAAQSEDTEQALGFFK